MTHSAIVTKHIVNKYVPFSISCILSSSNAFSTSMCPSLYLAYFHHLTRFLQVFIFLYAHVLSHSTITSDWFFQSWLCGARPSLPIMRLLFISNESTDGRVDGIIVNIDCVSERRLLGQQHFHVRLPLGLLLYISI